VDKFVEFCIRLVKKNDPFLKRQALEAKEDNTQDLKKSHGAREGGEGVTYHRQENAIDYLPSPFITVETVPSFSLSTLLFSMGQAVRTQSQTRYHRHGCLGTDIESQGRAENISRRKNADQLF